MSTPLPCPRCQREVSPTIAGTREHVERAHPGRPWAGEDAAAVAAARHACLLLDGLQRLNEERFTWLYAAVEQEHRRREAAAQPDAPWDPWVELRRRPWVDLEWAYLSSGRGRIEERSDGRSRRRVVTLDARLSREQRRFTLAHELVHDERDGGVDVDGMPFWWDLVVIADEGTVNNIAARRLGVERPA